MKALEYLCERRRRLPSLVKDIYHYLLPAWKERRAQQTKTRPTERWPPGQSTEISAWCVDGTQNQASHPLKVAAPNSRGRRRLIRVARNWQIAGLSSLQNHIPAGNICKPPINEACFLPPNLNGKQSLGMCPPLKLIISSANASSWWNRSMLRHAIW